MHTNVIPINSSRLALLANYLDRCPAAEKFYSDLDFGWIGAEGSQARSDRKYVGPVGAKPWESRILAMTFSDASVFLSASAEAILAVSRLITDPALGEKGFVGIDACCRASIESAAKAYWIVDPSVTAHDRACRGLLEHLHSALQAERLAKAMGWGQPVNELGISEASSDLEAKLTELGVSITWNRDRTIPTLDGITRPSISSQITSLVHATPYSGDKRMVYNLMSASAHATLYGILRVYTPGEKTPAGESTLDRNLDHRIVESSVGVTLMSFLAALKRVVEVMGWNAWKVWTLENMAYRVIMEGPR
jgi:hypothetical protein